jgi:nucleoside-diphosphate-sugar epimerase
MNNLHGNDFIVGADDLILITGATGFIGSRLVENLLDRGFRNVRCFVRPSSAAGRLMALSSLVKGSAQVQVITGNLLSREDCVAATTGAAVIYHCAAGRGEKFIPDAFLNSVVTTRNVMEAAISQRCVKRFVNVGSFTVYTNVNKPKGRLLDESCPVEQNPEKRRDAYCFAKVKQDEIVREYGARYGLPYVIVRPGYVYGPGNEGMTFRVGIDTFGIFLHLGGSNKIPITYVDNCAEAIALAGLKPGIDTEVFNVVDDDLPSSRWLLRQYKNNVRRFLSVYVPHSVSYILCYAWERYSEWSQGQLPPAFSRREWHASWKKSFYSNDKLKMRLGWTPKVSTIEGLRRHFEACRNRGCDA